MNKIKQKGFTLVEIAVVLVIIGLLLGGILKGQELINSARVRNLADQSSSIKAAYYGFIDRYRQVPGDFIAVKASQAIGLTVNLPEAGTTDGNGRIDNTLNEAAAVWEQLIKSNFLGGGFTPASAKPDSETAYANNAPVNAFNGSLILTRNSGYSNSNYIDRLNLHMGRNIPVNIARELDVKLDDGLPNTGVLRLTIQDGTDTAFDTINFTSQLGGCTTTNTANAPNNESGTGAATDIYDIFDDNQDCGQVFLH